ncbi:MULTISPECIES: alanine racemase [Methylobacterium]|uniref:Alanine racemase n=1 Tax=Methylobacterium oryzae CBMB20 TaxID=693986 RepID=A0A089NXT5_9HYPH|nr:MULTISPECIES: alanine racemase [Methylobacterium]AIQ92202.1 alanine racemase [Methylobacterium oryzae CBMB20]
MEAVCVAEAGPVTEIGAHGARLTIDLGAIVANWRFLAARGAGADCAAVVKADAYGCGIGRVGPALWAAGCRTFFVAHLSEGVAARAALPEAAIYILNGLPPGAAEAFAAHELRPVLGSIAELSDWAALSSGRLPAALHVDTGMNRLGLPVPEALDLAGDGRITAAGIDLLLSHFVSAEKPEDPVNARQIADFARVRAAYPQLRASLANSSGVFLDGARHDLLRPGYALFGGNPIPGGANPMRPVVRLEALIAQVRDVAVGATAGYNGRWTAPRPSRLATLSLGYADGFPRAVSGRGQALVGGVPCPILGLVSMDLIILDVTAAPAATRGATAVLIGDILDIDAVGRSAGTIGYEILTGLGSRYVRDYVG